MKRLVIFAFLSGCSGGSDGASPELTTGAYVITEINGVAGCNFSQNPGPSQNAVVTVTVDTQEVVIQGLGTFQRIGDDRFGRDGEIENGQHNTDGDECWQRGPYVYDGRITDDDEWRVERTMDLEVINPQNWAGCNFTECHASQTFFGEK